MFEPVLGKYLHSSAGHLPAIVCTNIWIEFGSGWIQRDSEWVWNDWTNEM